MAKKKSWLREEWHEAEHELGGFEKKVEKGLRHAEKKYGAPIGKTRDKFYSHYNKLTPEQKLKIREYAMILGTPTLGMWIFGVSQNLLLPVAILSEVPVFIDIYEARQKLKKSKARSKLSKVV